MVVPDEMNAVTIDRFGGPDVLTFGRQPVPAVGDGQVLIKVAYAGVGSWDPIEREGGFVEFTGHVPTFPHIQGVDGSGTVVAIGAGVERIAVGDRVYTLGARHYAEYVAIDADAVSPVPDGMSLEQAGAMPVAALTAWQGLAQELNVGPGDAVLITGASGDVGLVAVQVANLLGARVLAVASGDDGVRAARDLGAEVSIDGRQADVAAASRAFAPAGLNAIFATIAGATLEAAIDTLREKGRVAFPLGVQPEPEPRVGVTFHHFDLTSDPPSTTRGKIAKLNALIASGPFEVKVARSFPLAEAAAAQEALKAHRVGKIVLKIA